MKLVAATRACFVSLAVCFLTQPVAQAADEVKPNIIFILADDLGYGDLGCYGQKRIETPNLDRMAREGVRFTDCYAGATVCAPSRCSLMTGLHGGHARIRGNGLVPLRPEDTTVAETLRAAGYATGAIGKWGLGEEGSTGVPNRQGFDYWYGYLNQVAAHNYYPAFLWRNDEKVPLGNVLKPSKRRHGGVAAKKVDYSNDLFTDEAIAFIERHCDVPFFLYFPYTIPHANNEARDEGMEVPDLGKYAGRRWPEPQKGHAAMISRLDGYVGRLFEKLKELDLDQRTIVFFSSDNGPHKEGGADPEFFHSAGSLRGYKRSLHDGGIRVPMIVRWPGRIHPGETSDYVWAFWDFLPTAVQLAGVEQSPGIDGVSVLPVLLGEKYNRGPRFLYWEFHESPTTMQAVRFGRWKALRDAPGTPLRLYDLEADIGEQRDVAGQHPEIVEKIARYLSAVRTESKDFPLRRAP
ncbi:MAG: arylsulfatase [Pirellulales bacterium]|nr:arylsulfatase [Pirellulales bacterium]